MVGRLPARTWWSAAGSPGPERVQNTRRKRGVRHGDQIRPPDRGPPCPGRGQGELRRASRSQHPPAPQPQGRMGAAAGARKRAHHRRPDLAAVPGRRNRHADAGGIDARCRAALGRRGGARCRARRRAEHPLPRAVSLYRPETPRRGRQRGAQSGQPRVPRNPRDQERGAADRRALRRRARPLYQPRP